jgi:hypothetical protein
MKKSRTGALAPGFAVAVWSLLLAFSFSAFATTIPADLEARAAALRNQATPAMLSWVHERGAALAKASGPVDVAAVRTSAQTSWAVLGSMQGADIEALCFLVLMEASKSAQEDLKAIMAGVKAINNAKSMQRQNTGKVDTLVAASPTPAADRVAELVTAARTVEPKTGGAHLSRVVRR